MSAAPHIYTAAEIRDGAWRDIAWSEWELAAEAEKEAPGDPAGQRQWIERRSAALRKHDAR